MNDYLWDRSGEPDKEIQKLEEILAPLGYQPRPLEIPATIVPERRRAFLPALAIAATVALAVLALGLWLSVQRSQPGQPLQVNQAPSRTPENKSAPPQSSPEKQEVAAAPPQRTVNHPVTGRPVQNAAKRTAPRKLIGTHSNPELVAVKNDPPRPNDAEAVAAREQLITALRLVSTKLNHAQKRMQGGHPGNLIRNQHKVG